MQAEKQEPEAGDIPTAKRADNDIPEGQVFSNLEVDFEDGVGRVQGIPSGETVRLKVNLPVDKEHDKRIIVCLLYGYEYISSATSGSCGREVNVLFVRHTKTSVSGQGDKEKVVTCRLPTVCPASFCQDLLRSSGDETKPKTKPKPKSIFKGIVSYVAKNVNENNSYFKFMKSPEAAENIANMDLTAGIRYCCRVVVVPQQYENKIDNLQSDTREEWLPNPLHHQSEGVSEAEHSLASWETAPGASTAQGEIPVLQISDILEFECSGQPRVPIRRQILKEQSWFRCGGCFDVNEGYPSWDVMPERQFPSVIGGSEPAEKIGRLLATPLHFAKEFRTLVVRKVYLRAACDRSLLLPGDVFPIHIGVNSNFSVDVVTAERTESGRGHQVKLKQVCTLKAPSNRLPRGTPKQFVRDFHLLHSHGEIGHKPLVEWAQVPFDVLPSSHGTLLEVSHSIHISVMANTGIIATQTDLEIPVQVGKLTRQGVREDGFGDNGQLLESLLKVRFQKKLKKLDPPPSWTLNYTSDWNDSMSCLGDLCLLTSIGCIVMSISSCADQG